MAAKRPSSAPATAPDLAPDPAVGAYVVTRLPGAPPCRAGRPWAPGETRADDLSPAQLAALAADPGYRVAIVP
jgi:hypothetical protein